MRQTFRIIVLFGILTSCLTVKNSSNNTVVGKYEAYYDFDRLGFTKTLNLKRNGSFEMIRSVNTVLPSNTEFGEWKLSNDTIYLFKTKIKIDKHNRTERKKIICESESDLIQCLNDTLTISVNGLYMLNHNILYTKK